MHAVEFSRIGRSRSSAFQPRPQGNFTILSISRSLSSRRFGISDPQWRPTTSSARGFPSYTRSLLLSTERFGTGFRSPLEGARPSGPSLFPVGRTSNNLRATTPSSKSHPRPGRVALPGYLTTSFLPARYCLHAHAPRCRPTVPSVRRPPRFRDSGRRAIPRRMVVCDLRRHPHDGTAVAPSPRCTSPGGCERVR